MSKRKRLEEDTTMTQETISINIKPEAKEIIEKKIQKTSYFY